MKCTERCKHLVTGDVLHGPCFSPLNAIIQLTIIVPQKVLTCLHLHNNQTAFLKGYFLQYLPNWQDIRVNVARACFISLKVSRECISSLLNTTMTDNYLIQRELAVSQRGQGDLMGAHQTKVAGAASVESRKSCSWRSKKHRMKTWNGQSAMHDHYDQWV